MNAAVRHYHRTSSRITTTVMGNAIQSVYPLDGPPLGAPRNQHHQMSSYATLANAMMMQSRKTLGAANSGTIFFLGLDGSGKSSILLGTARDFWEHLWQRHIKRMRRI
jgi:hypothetical protein